jgi:hypothetical protein
VNADTLHACPLHFPGAALELSADGLVLASNGHLDALAGRDRVGLPLADVLDATSRPKWQRLLSEADSVNPACTWELVLTTPTSLRHTAGASGSRVRRAAAPSFPSHFLS